VEATVMGSKGCGANMRVQSVAFAARSAAERAGVAQFQAALTHGHPTALAASDLTAEAIALLAGGAAPARLPGLLREHARASRETYHEAWLGPLWQRPGEITKEAFIARGWDECLGVLDRLDAALTRGDRQGDPCAATGEGWIAEQALATGLLCFLLFPEDPIAALRRAALTSGDSDSIACLTGAFAGAHGGIEAWPSEWRARIEYKDRLASLGAAWDG
jgi:ADP-ribosylglycohydrolase